MSVLAEKIDILSRWTVKLAYLNLLWLLFCILGGLVFGWAPATVSIFTILKKWIEKKDLSINRTFFLTFKKHFIKSNVSGLTIGCLIIIFLINIYILFQHPNTLISVVFLIGNGTMISLFILSLMFFFPIYVHYQGKLKVIVSKVFFITLRELPFTILALIISIIWGGVVFNFPGLIFFFSISVPALIITLIFNNVLADKIYYFNNLIEME